MSWIIPKHMRVSLRFAVIMLTLLCAALAWIGKGVVDFTRERSIAAQVQNSGGVILWSTATLDTPDPRPGYCHYLLSAATAAVPPHIDGVDYSRGAISQKQLQLLAKCSNLWYLRMTGTHIRDEDIGHLASFSALKHLDISGTQITAVGIAELSTLSHLQILFLSDDMIGPEELKALSRLQQLRWLCILGCDDDYKKSLLRKRLHGCRVD